MTYSKDLVKIYLINWYLYTRKKTFNFYLKKKISVFWKKNQNNTQEQLTVTADVFIALKLFQFYTTWIILPFLNLTTLVFFLVPVSSSVDILSLLSLSSEFLKILFKCVVFLIIF